MLARGFKHRAASAGLLATVGAPASCTFLMRCIRNARIPQAAAGLRLERRRRWHVRAHHRSRGDLIEVAAPEWLPLAACSNAPDISCICADPRASTGTSVSDRGSTGESLVARLLKFAPPMCSVHSRTGQWACPATHAASCSAADGRRSASARSASIGSIMRAPSHAIDHHRGKPSLGPILHRATKRI